MSKNLKASKNLLDRIEKVEGELWDYFRLIHSEKSNETFDEEHDGLLYHLEGLAETIHELQNDININDGAEFEKYAEHWEKQVQAEEECLRQVGAYYWATVNSPKPEYIYG